MKTLHWICLILAIVGALNWGLVGLFEYDLVATIFGGEEAVGSRIVYSLVGLAGLVLLFTGTTVAAPHRVSHQTHSPAA